jgi:hypothetical protein
VECTVEIPGIIVDNMGNIDLIAGVVFDKYFENMSEHLEI